MSTGRDKFLKEKAQEADQHNEYLKTVILKLTPVHLKSRVFGKPHTQSMYDMWSDDDNGSTALAEALEKRLTDKHGKYCFEGPIAITDGDGYSYVVDWA